MGKRMLLYFDDLNMPKVDLYGTQQPIALLKTLIERRYSRTGRNYAYVHGKAFTHKGGIPQIQIESADQIRDAPSKDPLKLHHSGEAYHLAAASVKVKGVAA